MELVAFHNKYLILTCYYCLSSPSTVTLIVDEWPENDLCVEVDRSSLIVLHLRMNDDPANEKILNGLLYSWTVGSQLRVPHAILKKQIELHKYFP